MINEKTEILDIDIRENDLIELYKELNKDMVLDGYYNIMYRNDNERNYKKINNCKVTLTNDYLLINDTTKVYFNGTILLSLKNQDWTIDYSLINYNLTQFIKELRNKHEFNTNCLDIIFKEFYKPNNTNVLGDNNTFKMMENLCKWINDGNLVNRYTILNRLIEKTIYEYKKIYNNRKDLNKDLRNILKEYKKLYNPMY